MVVNFTSTVETTNPTVDTFTLYDNVSEVSSKRDSGVWIRALNSGGEVPYNCDVKNSVDIISSDYANVTVEAPISS